MSKNRTRSIPPEKLQLLKRAFSVRYSDLVLTPEQVKYFDEMRQVHETTPSKTIKYR